MSNDRAPKASTILADGYSYVEIFHEPADADGHPPGVPPKGLHPLHPPPPPPPPPAPPPPRESAPS